MRIFLIIWTWGLIQGFILGASYGIKLWPVHSQEAVYLFMPLWIPMVLFALWIIFRQAMND